MTRSESSRRWQLRNLEHHRQYQRDYRKKHPEIFKNSAQRMRDRESKAGKHYRAIYGPHWRQILIIKISEWEAKYKPA